MGRWSALDTVVVGVYGALCLGVGAWLGRRQGGATEYFLGRRALPWWAVLGSVVATETSTLTLLSVPGLAYGGDFGFLQLALGYVIGRVVAAAWVLPLHFRGEAATAYGILERRFGLGVRRFASGLFLVTRVLGDGVRLFATALPLALLTGWDVRGCVLALGAATLLYTWHGGLRAVVWVDVLQFGVYLLGALAALAVLGRELPGGWGAAWSAGAAAGKLTVFHFSFALDRPYTLLAGLVGGAFLSVASHGTDQLIVQRLLACRSLRDGQRALVGSGVVVVLQFALFLVLGLGLWAFYQGRAFARTDEVFATFLVQRMPTGLLGLVVAGMLAAAMSTLSSSLNALASAIAYDFWAPWRGGDERTLLRVGRAATVGWAVLLVGGALLLGRGTTPVVELGLAIASFTYGGLLGAFLLARWQPGAAGRVVRAAMLAGVGAMTLVAGGRWWAQVAAVLGWTGGAMVFGTLGRVAWPWHAALGAGVTVAVGWLLAWRPAGRVEATDVGMARRA